MALVGTQLRWSRRREAYPIFAETFGMPIYVNGMGRGSLPPDNPYFFSQTRKDALKQADVVLIFGTPLDFRLGYGRDSHFNPSATIIQVDLDGGEIGRNRPIDIGIVGDTGIVMEQLTGLAQSEGYSAAMVKPWLDEMRQREHAEVGADARRDGVRRGADQPAARVQGDRRRRSARTRSSSATAATSSPPRRRSLRIYEQGHWLDPGPLGTLGVGPGLRDGREAGEAAEPGGHHLRRRLVRPARAWSSKPWSGRRSTSSASIGNDAAWTADPPRPGAALRRGARGGDRASASSHYEKVVEALGGHGEYVERPEQIRPALERALGAGKPALVNIKIGSSDFRKDAISI